MERSSDFPIDHEITDAIILERHEGKRRTNVPHRVVHHSPDGYEWGYGGSGPADLALNILEAVLISLNYKGNRTSCHKGSCFKEAWRLHQYFKWEFIANAPSEGKRIPYPTIVDWIKERSKLI